MQIQQIIKKCSMDAKGDQELAVRLHDYVRDHVHFGFTRCFDQASLTYTVENASGHCNPKSALLTALFNSAGFEAYQHFMVIKKTLLKGCLPLPVYTLLPPVISHAVTDVRLQEPWYSLDSYVLDPVLFHVIQKKLQLNDQAIGFGSHIQATCYWDGEKDAFSQAGEKSLMVEDHGRIRDVQDYYRSSQYKNKVLGRPMGDWLRWLGPLGGVWEKVVNSVLSDFRKEGNSIKEIQ